MLIFICFIVLAQAYVFQWIIPEYQTLVANATTATPNFTKGYTYLLLLVAAIVALAIVIFVMTRKKIVTPDTVKPV